MKLHQTRRLEGRSRGLRCTHPTSTIARSNAVQSTGTRTQVAYLGKLVHLVLLRQPGRSVQVRGAPTEDCDEDQTAQHRRYPLLVVHAECQQSKRRTEYTTGHSCLNLFPLILDSTADKYFIQDERHTGCCLMHAVSEPSLPSPLLYQQVRVPPAFDLLKRLSHVQQVPPVARSTGPTWRNPQDLNHVTCHKTGKLPSLLQDSIVPAIHKPLDDWGDESGILNGIAKSKFRRSRKTTPTPSTA